MGEESTRLDKSGISYINRMIGTNIGAAVAFFVAARRLDIVQGWIYFGFFVLLGLSNIALLAWHDMSLLNERGKTRADVHEPDRVLVVLYLLFTHVLAPLVAGLEWRAFAGHPSVVAAVAGTGGLVLLLSGGALENWATYVNHYYERSIRLQKDRQQNVATHGPYAMVRHPGYLSYILRFAALPLALGSLFAIVPVAAGIVVLARRTDVEDRLLMENLSGYKEYAANVKYRLVPLVW